MQDEIINNTYWLGGPAGVQVTDKNMSMSRPVYLLSMSTLAYLLLGWQPITTQGMDQITCTSWNALMHI